MPAPSSRPVLLVEDDENDILFLQRALTRIHSSLPLQVITDGRAAWDYLSGSGATHRPNRPSLIILDLKLPKMSGLEILASLKADVELKSVPVLVMSASYQRSDVDTAYSLGADFYIVKSAQSEVTVGQARAVHAYWEASGGNADDAATASALALIRGLAEPATAARRA
jgi:CheY-like chemotaxis protein